MFRFFVSSALCFFLLAPSASAQTPELRQRQKEILERFPDSLWFETSERKSDVLQGRTLPLTKQSVRPPNVHHAHSGEAFEMSFDAKPELADFNDRTIFLVYKPNPISNEGTLLRIGDATRNHHGLVVKPHEVAFHNSTDFDDTHYRYRYDAFPDPRAANAPILDTQKFFLYPATADVAERAAIPTADDKANVSTYQVLAVRSDSLGKKGAFRIDVDEERASVFVHGRGKKRIKRLPTAERVKLSQKGHDMAPYYHTVRVPALCSTEPISTTRRSFWSISRIR